MPTDFILFSYKQLKCGSRQEIYLLPNQRLTYKPGYEEDCKQSHIQPHMTMEVTIFWCTYDERAHEKSKSINNPVTLTQLIMSSVFGKTSYLFSVQWVLGSISYCGLMTYSVICAQFFY